MRILNVIKALAFTGIGFLLLQLILNHLIFKEPSEQHKNVEKENDLKLYTLAYKFMTECTARIVPVFLVEPVILRAWISINETTQYNTCVYLCKAKHILTFGVLEKDWKDKGDLIKALKKGGLTVHEITERDPRKISVNHDSKDSIQTHYFIHEGSKTQPLIHLVLFYERKDSFWHSAVILDKNLQVIESKVTFAHTAGSYERFSLTQARIDGIWVFLPHTVKEFLDMIPGSTFIECNHTRAALFVSKYGSDNSGKAQLFTRKSRQLLKNAKEILDDLGVKFWLSSGTCLGWFRQCDIIPYSNDIDIGIFIKDYSEQIINSFENRGFKLKHVFGKESDSFELSFKAGEIKLDIFFFYEEENYIWNGGTDAWIGTKYKYIFPKFTLCWTELLELRVRVPCQTEAYINANYGKDWFIPVHTWSWKKSPPNVRENGVWPKDEWNKVIQVYE